MQELGHVAVQFVIELQTSSGLVQQVFIRVVTRHQRAQTLLSGPQQSVHLKPGVSIVRIPFGHGLYYGGLGRNILSDVADGFLVLLQFLLEKFLRVVAALYSDSLGDVVLLD